MLNGPVNQISYFLSVITTLNLLYLYRSDFQTSSNSEIICECIVFWALGRAPWTGDDPTQGPSLHSITLTENMQTNIHASCGIQTHDPSVQVVKDIKHFGRCSQFHQPTLNLRMKNEVTVSTFTDIMCFPLLFMKL
jgi:hypothetical protein